MARIRCIVMYKSSIFAWDYFLAEYVLYTSNQGSDSQLYRVV